MTSGLSLPDLSRAPQTIWVPTLEGIRLGPYDSGSDCGCLYFWTDRIGKQLQISRSGIESGRYFNQYLFEALVEAELERSVKRSKTLRDPSDLVGSLAEDTPRNRRAALAVVLRVVRRLGYEA